VPTRHLLGLRVAPEVREGLSVFGRYVTPLAYTLLADWPLGALDDAYGYNNIYLIRPPRGG
jgi:hypothetical protein